MTKQKYAKYFITDWRHPPLSPEVIKKTEEQIRSGHYVKADEMYYMADSIIKGAFYMTCVMVQEVKGGTPVEHAEGKPHSHDFDEVLLFAGTDPDDPHNLGGEIEIWIEDEKYIITKGCMIFIPKGIKHLPLIFRKIGRPVYFITAGSVTKYEQVK
jgi:mannose-6-phosphate isomerase-like protein (cupin superfamily)